MGVTKLRSKFGVSGILAQFDLDRSRWFFWFPVAMAIGIALYFSLRWHPSLIWLATTPTVAFISFFTRNSRYQSIRLFLFFALAVSLGFSASIVREYVVSAPVLQKKQVTVKGGTKTGHRAA